MALELPKFVQKVKRKSRQIVHFGHAVPNVPVCVTFEVEERRTKGRHFLSAFGDDICCLLGQKSIRRHVAFGSRNSETLVVVRGLAVFASA